MSGAGVECISPRQSPQCVPLVCEKFAENPEFRMGNFAANLKREICHRKLKCHEPTPLCDIPSGCCFFTGPWTVTRSSLRMLRRLNACCRPVLLLVSFPRSRNPIVGVPGLCCCVNPPPTPVRVMSERLRVPVAWTFSPSFPPIH